jgi:hypothetical protein
LKNLGATRLEAAPPRDYAVPSGFAKGLPPGMGIEERTAALYGSPSEPGRKSVALLYGVNSRGVRVIQIWVRAEAGR